MSVTVFFDGDCPFCKSYVRLLRLRQAAGPVTLVDLRRDAGVRATLEGAEFELDQGMVVETDGRRFAGADAIHVLALLSTDSQPFNRASRWVLSSRAVAAVLYPALRSGRWLALFAMGRDSLAQPARDSGARAEIFGCFFSLFSAGFGFATRLTRCSG